MTPLEIITKSCVAANPSIMELKFGCFINPTSDSIHFALRDCVGGVETIEIINDEDDIIFGKAKLIEPKKILGRPIRLADVLLAVTSEWKGKHRLDDEGYMEFLKEEKNAVLEVTKRWNFYEDDLSKQKAESLAFLANLLKT